MLTGKDKVALELEIKSFIPQYSKEKMMDFTRGVILNIHHSLVINDPNNIKIRVSKELINKINSNKDNYRISKNFDKVLIQHIGLYDFEKNERGMYVKMFANICFYDDVDNNEDGVGGNDKFWNDRWIITYEAISNIDNKCRNCGSEMDYNRETNMYECKFCRSSFYKDSEDWKVVDIEVE